MRTAPVTPTLSALSLPPVLLIQVGCVPCTRQSMTLVLSSLSRVVVLGKRVVWLLMEPVLFQKWLYGMCGGKMGECLVDSALQMVDWIMLNLGLSWGYNTGT